MNTPKTDSLIKAWQMHSDESPVAPFDDIGGPEMVFAKHARQLETQVQELRGIIQKYLDSADKPLGMSDLADIDAEARAVLERTK